MGIDGHFSTALWLNAWYVIFAVGTALITWRTGPARTPSLPSQSGKGRPAGSMTGSPLDRAAATEETGTRIG